MTEDHMPIGPSLTLGLGIPEVIGLLEPELNALYATLAVRCPMLHALTQLGQRLNTFMANAAPTIEWSGHTYGADAVAEHGLPDVPGRIRAGHANRLATRNTRRLPPPLATNSSERVTLAEATTPSTRYMPLYSATPGQRTPMPTAKATARSDIGTTIAPKEPSPAEPEPSSKSSIPSIAIIRHGADAVNTPWMLQRLSPSVAASLSMDVDAGASSEIGAATAVTPAVVPSNLFAADAEAASTQRVGASDVASFATSAPFMGVADTVMASDRLEGLSPYRQGSRTATEDRTETESEPRQGTIVLDGAQLGRWMIDHLERRASRPRAMTTGIDPRMSPTFPGAPTGG
jgi:hypothetical protein